MTAAARAAVDHSFFARPVTEVAPDLLGWTVRHGETAGVIVETEAYHDSEPACHAYIGLTPRTKTLFGPPGLAYVYRSYGVHAMLNAVSEPEGVGAAVLIRALEPTEGIDTMRRRRGLEKLEDLTSGPGKLTQALGIWLDRNGGDLLTGPVRLEPPEGKWVEARHLAVAPRVGINCAMDLPWRYCAIGTRCVSRPWPPGLRDALAA